MTGQNLAQGTGYREGDGTAMATAMKNLASGGWHFCAFAHFMVDPSR
jgi:hypothetical protein